MGLLGRICEWRRRKRRRGPAPVAPGADSTGLRVCRIEPMESRQLLSAAPPDLIHVGTVYFENHLDDDSEGDTFEVTYSGGAPGTLLTELTIDTDKDGLGRSDGDPIFDTLIAPPGCSLAASLVVVDKSGLGEVKWFVEDGGTSLKFTFTDFNPGEKLVFTIDVDERGYFPDSYSPFAEGAEFEGSKLSATFTSPQCEDALASAIFINQYETALTDSGLSLPHDDYIPPATESRADDTAGAFDDVQQPWRPVSLSGQVFEDWDGDNVRDFGEDRGLDVPVTLALEVWENGGYVSTGRTTQTRVEAGHLGEFAFDGLDPGKYRVVETQPADYLSVGAREGTVDGELRGRVESPDVITDIELFGGDESVDNLFAEAKPVTVRGTVFEDMDGDNVLDPQDHGIADTPVTVELQRLENGQFVTKDTVQTSQQEASAGTFRFEGQLPGTYRLVETQPPGYLSIGAREGTVDGQPRGTVESPDVITNIVLHSRDDDIDNLFAEAKPITISGTVFEDMDGDNVMDLEDKGIGGTTVTLLQLQQGTYTALRTTQTSVAAGKEGTFQFDGLAPGTYRLVETQPDGYLSVGAREGTVDGEPRGKVESEDVITDIELFSGDEDVKNRFAEARPISLSGYVFLDLDADLVMEAGDRPLAQVLVGLFRLKDGQSVQVASADTDADGQFRFAGLLPGEYRLVEMPVHEYSVGAIVGTVDGQPRGTVIDPDTLGQINLFSGDQGINYAFADTLPVSISGRVFDDRAGNLLFDEDDAGIAGVSVELMVLTNGEYTRTGKTTVTDSNGRYQFDALRPGNYSLIETQPTGYLSVGAVPGTVDGIPCGVVRTPDILEQITVGGGDQSVDNLFAEARPITISGTVFEDFNGDNLWNGADHGIGDPPVTVTLQRLQGTGYVTQSTVQTSSTGTFRFENLLPGTYGLVETQPGGYLSVGATAGTVDGEPRGVVEGPDGISQIRLRSGEDDINNLFAEAKPVTIEGLVFDDRGADLAFDAASDHGIGGVALALWQWNGQEYVATGKTTQTGATAGEYGKYRFSGLMPGKYRVVETQPAVYLSVGAIVGTVGGQPRGAVETADILRDIELQSGDRSVDNDFAECLPSSLSGAVVFDRDQSGTYSPGDPPIPGAVVQLLNASGSVIATQTTNASGVFTFSGLLPGQYGLHEIQPAGYPIDGQDQIGSAGGVLVSPDSMVDIQLVSGTHADNYIFCELKPAALRGRVFADLADNGVFDAGDWGIGDVELEAIGTDGISHHTKTNADGYYEFLDLIPGEYRLIEHQPADYFDGQDHVGTAGGIVEQNDQIGGIKLTTDLAGEEYNFAELPPAKLSGYVFQDGGAIYYFPGQRPAEPYTLRDGQHTSDDTPLAGVVLMLRDQDLQPVYVHDQPMIAVTDAQGYYEFAGLPPGTYSILEIQPAGYDDGLDTAGSCGGIALNPDVFIDFETIDPGLLEQILVETPNDAIIQITLGPDSTGVQYDFSELLLVPQGIPDEPRPPEPELPPVSPPEPDQSPLAVWHETPVMVQAAEAIYFAGGLRGSTWHLSVINAGNPRHAEGGIQIATAQTAADLFSVGWGGEPLNVGEWVLADGEGQVLRTFQFGTEDAIPVTGDWNGEGITKVGVFREGVWYLDLNGDGRWDEDDLWARMGKPTDLPAAGDWDGDGKTDIATYGPSWEGDERALEHEPGLPDVNNKRPRSLARPHKNVPPDPLVATIGMRTLKRTTKGPVRKDLIDHVLQWGTEDERPVTGDWNGDGVSNIGAFRDGLWRLDADGDGQLTDKDVRVQYGSRGDVPVVGDWTGDGHDKIGVFRHGTWYLDINGDRALDAGDRVVKLGGQPGDVPIVGDWDGDGVDEIGIYRAATPEPSAGQATLRIQPQAIDEAVSAGEEPAAEVE